MIRTSLLAVAAASLLRVCGNRTPPPPRIEAAASAHGAQRLVPEHGGQLAFSGGLTAEVAPLADGRVAVYVRDAQRQPVDAQQVEVTVRQPDGQTVLVPVSYDPALRAFVGRPVGFAAGSYPVEVHVHPAADAPEVAIITPPVALAPRPAAPRARFGGRVEVVGDHAVETVAAEDGHVAMYWMNLEGEPIPASEVDVPEVRLTFAGRTRVVRPRVERTRLVADVEVPPRAEVIVGVPLVTVRGVPYRRVYFARPVAVVHALPPAVVVEAPRPRGVVVVERPQPPVFVAPAAVVVVPVGGPPGHWRGRGHGWGHGWGRGGGRGWGHGGGHGGGWGRGGGRGRH